jgi:DedD protein
MEKEQKKLLLVAVSAGVFLLVIITAAMIIVTPKAHIEETAFSSSNSMYTRVQPVEKNNIQPLLVVPEITEIAVITDKNEGDHRVIQIPSNLTAAGVPDIRESSSSNTVVTINTAKPAVNTSQKQAVDTSPKPAANTSQKQAANTQKPAASANVQEKSSSSAKPAAPAKKSNDYWVQTGAFTAKIRAEDAKELLASKGIISIIENRQIDGQTWYRVRLGPYTSEKEANYWLALVQTINGFDKSQVRQTVRQ